MLAIVFGFLGLVVGSFLNVCILRYRARPFGGRSACLSCGARIAWYDNVPVFSYLVLRGRCRACGSRISLQYPLVEIVTAAVFALVGTVYATPTIVGLIVTTFALSFAALFIAIAWYDLRHTIIPDVWVALAAILALGVGLATHEGLWWLLGGPVAALPLFLLWLVSGGRWMGLGDVKLALPIGWLLGPYLGTIAVFGAFMLGAATMVPLLALSAPALRQLTPMLRTRLPRGGFTMKSEVPFGPFLIASCLLLWCATLYHVPLPL